MLPPEFIRPSRLRTSASTEMRTFSSRYSDAVMGVPIAALRTTKTCTLGAQLQDHFPVCPPYPLPPAGGSLCLCANRTFLFIAFLYCLQYTTAASICQVWKFMFLEYQKTEFHSKKPELVQTRSGFLWWTLGGSNPRPSARQADALPAELSVRIRRQNTAFIYFYSMLSTLSKDSLSSSSNSERSNSSSSPQAGHFVLPFSSSSSSI